FNYLCAVRTVERDDHIHASLINHYVAELTLCEREAIGVCFTSGKRALDRLRRLERNVTTFLYPRSTCVERLSPRRHWRSRRVGTERRDEKNQQTYAQRKRGATRTSRAS